MYRVLLVDDEPLILSGIKFMIDWEAYDCQIVDTARNGQKALEKVRALQPDIVICDISMPVLSGTELLEKAHTESPETVFIMLTNHPDFQYAQQALQYRAVDYLLKSQLDSETLIASLQLACAERKKRQQLAHAVFMDEYRQSNEIEHVKNAISQVMNFSSSQKYEQALQFLASHQILESYAIIYMPIDFTALPGCGKSTPQDNASLFSWHKEITEKIAENSFAQHVGFLLEKEQNSLFLFCWNLKSEDWHRQLDIFSQKLISATGTITRLPVKVYPSPVFKGRDDMERCRNALFSICNTYYLEGVVTTPVKHDAATMCSLELSGIAERLAAELKARHASGCAAVLDRAIDRVSEIPHGKGQAIWLCSELAGVIDMVFGPGTASFQVDISEISTRAQVLKWLEQAKRDINARLSPSANSKTELLEKARQYVRDNSDCRIMLQDAADFANISPGYLSALHNKVYGQKFVDYIHQIKMERACQMISEGRYRISEIAHMLSFENAYYFTRVFKKCMGVTPSEYQKNLFAEKEQG